MNSPCIGRWPPFSSSNLPPSLYASLHKFNTLPINTAALKEPIHGSPLITYVVPFYNARPSQFADLLFSLFQQTDQNYNLLLVDDGSDSPESLLILEEIASYPRVNILRKQANSGISNAINLAVSSITTPFFLIIDQDDCLSPDATEIFNLKLSKSPGLSLVYADHIAFDDVTHIGEYIPKFPWNPIALLDFNYIIHPAVISTHFFLSQKGFNSSYDGIQDWEFFLRVSPRLGEDAVGYIPLPLYLWRLSVDSVSSSAQPQEKLLEKAREFVDKYANQYYKSSTYRLIPSSKSHYRTACIPHDGGATHYDILIFSCGHNTSLLKHTLDSISSSSLLPRRIVICSSLPIDNLIGCTAGCESSIPTIIATPSNVGSHIDPSVSLLVLEEGFSFPSLIYKRSDIFFPSAASFVDALAIPVVSSLDNSIEHAGYDYLSIPGVKDSSLFPVAFGVSLSDYCLNFASFSHFREVDCVAPSVHFLYPHSVGAIVAKIPTLCVEVSHENWMSCIKELKLKTYCVFHLASNHDKHVNDEGSSFANSPHNNEDSIHLPSHIYIKSLPPTFSSLAQLLQADAILSADCSLGHPLHVEDYLSRVGSVASGHLLNLQHSIPRPSTSEVSRLIPSVYHRQLVIVIPTELNPKSNGHLALITLCSLLLSRGCDVKLLPYSPHKFFVEYYPSLPCDLQSLPFILGLSKASPQALLLVPETVPPALLARLRKSKLEIMWWLLAPLGLFTDKSIDIKSGDYLMPFSPFALPGQPSYLFVQPSLPTAFSDRISNRRLQRPKSFAIYVGKGRLQPLTRCLYEYTLGFRKTLITRSSPSNKDELADLLSSISFLISFDPLSNLVLEAAHLGIPTFTPRNPFSFDVYREFPADLSRYVFTSDLDLIDYLRSGVPLDPLAIDSLVTATTVSVESLQRCLVDPLSLIILKCSQARQGLAVAFAKKIERSHVFNVMYDGQSVSSAFSGMYLRSLYRGYRLHSIVCSGLAFLDGVASVFWKLGLQTFFRYFVFRLVIQKPALLVRRFLRLVRIIH